jgi:hypothetical protein
MVDIIVGGMPPVQVRPDERQGQRQLPPGKKRPFKERRKNPVDRRQEARFGVVVNLSSVDERRERPDRRKERSLGETYRRFGG